MSLSIKTQEITAVLIAGSWYEVKPGSFDLDAYEYAWGTGEGEWCSAGSDSAGWTGYVFTAPDGRTKMAGPIGAIQSVRTSK